MQPISDRLNSVHQFVTDVKPNIQYSIVPITDPFGPAVTDSQLECIVVSNETIRGAHSINVKRVEQVNMVEKLSVLNNISCQFSSKTIFSRVYHCSFLIAHQQTKDHLMLSESSGRRRRSHAFFLANPS